MPNEDGIFGFRPITADDLPMLAAWLRRPHWREWWGEPDEELATFRAIMEGRDSTRAFIILVNGEPSGYIQAWSVGDNREAEGGDHPWLHALPDEAIGVDLSLADGERLSRGHGSGALKAFVAMLREEGRRFIVIDPDAANGRAVRAYEKAGFRPIEALRGKTGDTLIMQYDPAAGPVSH